MDDSKKRFQIGFIGSLGFHLFVFLVLAFAGLFSANHVDDKIVEIAVFGGGGGGGGGGGSTFASLTGGGHAARRLRY